MTGLILQQWVSFDLVICYNVPGNQLFMLE